MRVLTLIWNGFFRLPDSLTTVPEPLGRRLRAFLGGLDCTAAAVSGKPQWGIRKPYRLSGRNIPGTGSGPYMEPFFMLDGYLCLGYNVLNKTADKEGHSFPFRRNHLTVTFK